MQIAATKIKTVKISLPVLVVFSGVNAVLLHLRSLTTTTTATTISVIGEKQNFQAFSWY